MTIHRIHNVGTSRLFKKKKNYTKQQNTTFTFFSLKNTPKQPHRQGGEKNSSKASTSAGYTVYIQNSNAFKKVNPGSKSTILSKNNRKKKEARAALK